MSTGERRRNKPGRSRPAIIAPCLNNAYNSNFIDSADLKYQAAQVLSKPIAAAVQAILASVTSGGKVLACGNGGSAADAQHFAAEFVGRYERERPELGAIALTTDSSILTAIANDYDFNGDLLQAGARPGRRRRRAAGHEHQRQLGQRAGRHRGRPRARDDRGGPDGPRRRQDHPRLLRETDVHICVPHERTARIQEVHLLVLHCICDGVDTQLLGDQETSV
jgi:D-sedoheptulose 7-phosphate isomerase